MSLSNIMGLLGGLALFLYGMQMMSNGLEQTARNQMRDILKKITSNRCSYRCTYHGCHSVFFRNYGYGCRFC